MVRRIGDIAMRSDPCNARYDVFDAELPCTEWQPVGSSERRQVLCSNGRVATYWIVGTVSNEGGFRDHVGKPKGTVSVTVTPNRAGESEHWSAYIKALGGDVGKHISMSNTVAFKLRDCWGRNDTGIAWCDSATRDVFPLTEWYDGM